MQFTKGATVKFTKDKNCFVKIPRQWGKISDAPLHFEIEYGSNLKCCLTWAGETTNDEHVIEINGVFGVKLGLQDGGDVCVRYSHTVTFPQCEKAILEPASMDEWEIMDMNASKIESELMNQIKVVWSHLTFPIWVNKSVCVFVTVGKTEPNSAPLVLNPGTELHISPATTETTNDSVERMQTTNQEAANSTGFFSSIFNTIIRTAGYNTNEDSNQNITPPPEPKLKPTLHEFEATFRVTPLTELFACSNEVSSVIFINDIDVPIIFRRDIENATFVACIKKDLSPYEKYESSSKKPLATSTGKKINDDENSNKKPTNKDEWTFDSAIVRVVLINYNLLNKGPKLNHGYVAVNDTLRRQLGLEATSRIVIKNLNYPHSYLTLLKLHPMMTLPISEETQATESFQTWVTTNTRDDTVLISKGTLVRLNMEKGKQIDLVLMPSNNESNANDNTNPYYYLTYNTVGAINIQIGEKISPIYKPWDVRLPFKSLTDLDVKPYGQKLITLGGVTNIAEQLQDFIKFSLGLSEIAKQLKEDTRLQVALVHGPKGVGKTTLIRSVCRELQDTKHRIYSQIVDCKQLRGKRADSIKKVWGGAFMEASHRQPSIVLLEDLECAASCISTPEQEASPDALYFAKVAATLLSIIKYFRDNSAKITVIVTAKSTESLHALLSNTRGRHLFSNVFELSPPNLAERDEILKSVILNKTSISSLGFENMGVAKIASKTEGYVTRDLETLVDRAIHFHAIRIYETEQEREDSSEGIALLEDDFEKAISDYTPLNLEGVKLNNETQRNWNDVGGLMHAKKILEQTLTWPLKYPKLFGSCPLRPQSGLLLYGAPGTGKTLLASVVASQCELNFISIKGPELLSKYIGASEQAVRDVFVRAQNAKPCAIFFDEFDAIAPRRGHDSTGVTDRVVNQLLTQMDGVEALQGVFVLAATSRPDLIDPALLRPGRLDKAVNCPMPNQNDREAILKALSRHLNLDPDVDLYNLSVETENFSGADLQALLYTAHVEALNESLENRSDNTKNDDPTDQMKDNYVYYESLGKGRKELTNEQKQKLNEEVAVIMENKMGLCQNQKGANAKTRRQSSAISTLIKMEHLKKALYDTKPSVSPKERTRYNNIYEKFSKNKSSVEQIAGEFSLDTLLKQKRVTLA